jgi:hypothetical protein
LDEVSARGSAVITNERASSWTQMRNERLA